jgi:hypothetical protein
MIVQIVSLLRQHNAVQDWLPVRNKQPRTSAVGGPTLHPSVWKERGGTLGIYSFAILELACMMIAFSGPAPS